MSKLSRFSVWERESDQNVAWLLRSMFNETEATQKLQNNKRNENRNSLIRVHIHTTEKGHKDTKDNHPPKLNTKQAT